MTCSEARLTANRANAARSTGPRTSEGKAVSRANSLKHGLAGGGIVMPEGEADEIARRSLALEAEMKPISSAGIILIAQMATLSVRSERAVRHELASTALRVRHAADAFDEDRIELAQSLFDSLADDPRKNLRRLRKMPEGVELLIEAWHDLRADLSNDPAPARDAALLERAAILMGLKSRYAQSSRIGVLLLAYQGDFSGLTDAATDGGGLVEPSRKAWAKAALVERIDAEIAGLEAHYETLDFEMIELDRSEAGDRALFDPSKEACLARRYASEASRGFFKALNEFRKVEAESETRADPAPAAPALTSAPPVAPLGSFRETAPPPDCEPSRIDPLTPMPEFSTPREPVGQPSAGVSPAMAAGSRAG